MDIDLKSFFDEVDHCLLLQLLYRKVKCRATLRLIRKWLRAPIQINGKLVKRRKGVPQGSPLRRLLSNIMLKTITRKTTPMSFDERIEKLKEVQRGWVNAFRMASIQNKLAELDGWLRNRLRYCIWHHWKKTERKRKNLIRLGVEPVQAYQWSRSRMGGWAIAQSPILGTTITIERLMKRGYTSILDLYKQISPQFNPE